MAVEIPPENQWTGKPAVLHNMQEVARDPRGWKVYNSLTPQQRENFKVALALDIVVPFSQIVAISRQPVAAAPPQLVVPTPESIVNYQSRASDFKDWLIRQATLVNSHAGLEFQLGDAYVLSDGTVSVPIVILRNKRECPRTRFVFHYHRGATGPAVGHAYASEGHFKPYDGAPKDVRIEKHDSIGPPLGSLRRDAKTRAKRLVAT